MYWVNGWLITLHQNETGYLLIMKHVLLVSSLLLPALIFPSASYAEWTLVAVGSTGNKSYVDFERIRKHDGYHYFWLLTDYRKPDEYGDFSSKIFYQGDCKLYRDKVLSFSFHKEPMGGGVGDVSEPIGQNGNWYYAAPGTIREIVLNSVCGN